MISDLDATLDPIGYVETYLNDDHKSPFLYPWQDKALAPLRYATGPKAKRINIAVAAPNGAGKDDRIICGAAYYWIGVHPRGKVVITSKSDLQLTQQTIPALERHKYKFGGYESVGSPQYELHTKTGGKIVAFVTKEASRAEGWHKEDDCNGPLLLILNEAKSIDEPIFGAFDRCTPNAVLMASSTGLKSGRFYDCFTKLRENWITIRAGLLDCSHIPQERIDYIRATYGEDHPITRSTLNAEFMDQDEFEQYCVSLSSLERCYLNPPQSKRGFVTLFCDFAGGGDQNVIVKRDGNVYTIEAAWRDQDKMRSIGRFIQTFRRLGVKPHQIIGDAADAEMLRLLAEAGWAINRQNFGAPAYDKETYLSWSAEAWLTGSTAIEKCEVILPDDEELKAQLTTRKKLISSRGKLAVEDKFVMRKRNIPSPDKADALFGAMAQRDMESYKSPLDLSQWREHVHEAEESEWMVEEGVCAGL